MNSKIFLGTGFDPWHNLAIEEYLLENVQPEECILYLWQNQNTVVIGKNQNPWRECQTKLLEAENGKLARRLSGGGAVFHDVGNLNFTFIVDKALYNLEKQLQVILDAVKNLGIKAQFSGRNDIVTHDNRKFSGNAFYLRKDRAFHHGTILVHADLEKLSRYLQVSKEKMESKGIKSVSARVANLLEYVSKINIEKMKNALMTSFSELYGDAEIIKEEDFDAQRVQHLYEKYSSWQWRYGESPSFDMVLSSHFPWGNIELGIGLEQGKITKATLYSDAMEEHFIEKLPEVLIGVVFDSESIVAAIDKFTIENELQKTMVSDIANWLSAKGF